MQLGKIFYSAIISYQLSVISDWLPITTPRTTHHATTNYQLPITNLL
ncbi:hypothetical protein [Chroococcidiopsis sp.]